MSQPIPAEKAGRGMVRGGKIMERMRGPGELCLGDREHQGA